MRKRDRNSEVVVFLLGVGPVDPVDRGDGDGCHALPCLLLAPRVDGVCQPWRLTLFGKRSGQ
jgi:hypothetical protein